MITAAERTNTLLGAGQIYFGTANFVKSDFSDKSVSIIAYISAAGDFRVNNCVKPHRIKIPRGDAVRGNYQRFHTAPDVNTHKVRHNFVVYRHGRADGTTRSGVNVRHQAYFASSRKGLIAQRLYLFPRIIVELAGKNFRAVIFSAYFKHSCLLSQRTVKNASCVIATPGKLPLNLIRAIPLPHQVQNSVQSNLYAFFEGGNHPALQVYLKLILAQEPRLSPLLWCYR
jgi:hypothetical protein